MSKRWLVVALLLSGCGTATRRYEIDGECYEKTRTWLVGVTLFTETYPCLEGTEP